MRGGGICLFILPGRVSHLGRSRGDMSGRFILIIYYPPEVRRGKYWGVGVFLLQ